MVTSKHYLKCNDHDIIAPFFHQDASIINYLYLCIKYQVKLISCSGCDCRGLDFILYKTQTLLYDQHFKRFT